ncbi:MAG: hypothetical protein PHI34_12295, partial [Acidobacteriota bacterium]|nr:hypothetical protein [Acidobacteriota bacterium]
MTIFRRVAFLGLGWLALAALAAAQMPLPSAGPAPDLVRPGFRLTYYIMTGSLSGSVNGWVPDENGDWADKTTGRRYATERQGYGSHGLIQAPVVG